MVHLRQLFSRPAAVYVIIILFAGLLQSCGTVKKVRYSNNTSSRVLHAEAMLSARTAATAADTQTHMRQAPLTQEPDQALALTSHNVNKNGSGSGTASRWKPKLHRTGFTLPKPSASISKLYYGNEPQDEGLDEGEGNCCVNRWCLSYFLLVGVLALALVLIGSATTFTPFLGWLALILILVLVGVTIVFLVYVLEDGDRRDNLLTPPKGRKKKKSETIEIEE